MRSSFESHYEPCRCSYGKSAGFERELNLCDEQFRRSQLPGENVGFNSEIGDMLKDYLLMLKRCQLRCCPQTSELR